MNAHQEVWWDQVRSDHTLLVLLRRDNVHPCHQLHYLQMVTEKLGKAYFWRDRASGRSHASFRRFLSAFDNRPDRNRSRIARLLGFRGPDAFELWVKSSAPLALEVERLAPALAGDSGPNPEYPWPRDEPIFAPATFSFPIWDRLNSGPGRHLLRVIDEAVRTFPEYA